MSSHVKPITMFIFFIVVILLGFFVLINEKLPTRKELMFYKNNRTSQKVCVGVETKDRRCNFENVVFINHELIYLNSSVFGKMNCYCGINEECTIIEKFNETDAFFSKLSSMTIYPTVVIFRRMINGNYGHVVFENLFLLINLLWEEGLLQPNFTKFGNVQEQLSEVLIIFDDNVHSEFPHFHKFWEKLGLNFFVSNTKTEKSLFIQKMIVGTKNKCAHQRCKNNEKFSPIVATLVRNLVILSIGKHCKYDDPSVYPRITIVQRKGTRKIINLNELVNTIKGTIQINDVSIVNDGLSFEQQACIFCRTDIVIYVHGGVAGNFVFLPFGAVLLEIDTIFFSPKLHPYFLWISEYLSTQEIIYHPFEIINARNVKYKQNSTPVNCRCPGTNMNDTEYTRCSIDIFLNTHSVYIDYVRFVDHIRESVRKWSGHLYLSPHEDQLWKPSRKPETEYFRPSRMELPWYYNIPNLLPKKECGVEKKL